MYIEFQIIILHNRLKYCTILPSKFIDPHNKFSLCHNNSNTVMYAGVL